MELLTFYRTNISLWKGKRNKKQVDNVSVSKSLKCYVTVLGMSWFSLAQPTSVMEVKGSKPQERGKGGMEKGGEMGLDGEYSRNGLIEKA